MTDGADQNRLPGPSRQDAPGRKNRNGRKRLADPARRVAARLLYEVLEEGAYANLGSIKLFDQPDLRSLDRRFASALVYGTISRLTAIDWILDQVSTRPVQGIDPWIRTILRLGVWQLYWSRSIPPMAAVDESVRLTGQDHQSSYAAGRKGAAGFVNAVLRRLADHPVDLPENNLPVRYSMPPSLYGYLRKWYGDPEAKDLAQAFLEDAGQVTARVNYLRTTRTDVLALLQEQGIAASPGRYCPEAVRLDLQGTPIRSLHAWQEGLLTIQDEAAMLVAHVAAPAAGPDQLIIDLCAAPGGKTCHLAEWTNDLAPILAFDIHPSRLKLISEAADRLGIRSISTACADAADGGSLSERPAAIETTTDDTLTDDLLTDESPAGSAHDPFANLDGSAALVLADVPCSGLGLLGRKPEIKMHMTHERMISLYPLQASILRRAGTLVRPGGTLVYSTCTINPAENIDQVQAFIQALDGLFVLAPITDFLPPSLLQDPIVKEQAEQGWVQLLPHRHHVDGFFIARMKRTTKNEADQETTKNEADQQTTKNEADQQTTKNEEDQGTIKNEADHLIEHEMQVTDDE